MGVINTIRNKSGLAVGLIAGCLILFLLGRDILSINSVILGKDRNTIGIIAGEKVDGKLYQAEIEHLKYIFTAQYNRYPKAQENMLLQEEAWQSLIQKKVYQKQYNLLGLQVSKEELVDMVQGDHIHPALIAAFTDKKTGVFDKMKIVQYLQNIAKLSTDQQAQWYRFESSLIPMRLNEKYKNLLKKSSIVTHLEKQQQKQLATHLVDIQYLYIPYYAVPDSAIQITDPMLANYLHEHKAAYQVPESRSMQYIVLPIAPTSEDTSTLLTTLKILTKKWTQAQDPIHFAQKHTDAAVEDVCTNLTTQQCTNLFSINSKSLKKGMVIGPIVENDVYSLYTIVDYDRLSKTYKTACIQKYLFPSDHAKNSAFRKATYLAQTTKSIAMFKQMAKEEALQLHNAQQVDQSDHQIGTHQQAREIVRWLYNDAKKGKISPVFELANCYIVAIMTDECSKGTAPLEHVRNSVYWKVKKQLKAQEIIQRINTITDTTTFATLAIPYKNVASIVEAKSISWQDNILPVIGLARKTIGSALVLQPGKYAPIIEDENGITILKLKKVQKNKSEKYDAHHMIYTIQLLQKALEELAAIQDKRVRFF